MYGDIKVSHKDKKDFTISHKGKKIAALHTVPINLKDGYADKFIIEYDDPEYEIEAEPSPVRQRKILTNGYGLASVHFSIICISYRGLFF